MLPMHHRSMLNCLGLFKCSLSLSVSQRTAFDCVFPKGCVRTLLAPMQALSIVSMPPKPFWCMPRFPLITRVATLLQCACFCHRTTNKVRAVQTHCGSRSLVSVVLYIAGWSNHTRPCLGIRNQHQKHLFV